MRIEIRNSTSILILVFIVLAVYYPAIFAPLNSVDDPGMYQYLLNTDHLTLRTIFLPGGSGSYYRPILLASFLADKYVWGLEESFMHLENMLFHLSNTLLVFAITCKACSLQSKDTPLVPLVAALFFAIHPINTEAVNWISGRTDLLAAFFLLLSTLILLRRPLTPVASCAAAITMLAACMAKETAIFFLPAAMIAPLFTVTENGVSVFSWSFFRKHAPHLAVFTMAGAGYFLSRRIGFSQGDQGVATVLTHVAGDQSAGVLVSLRLMLKALGFYAKKLVVPFPLNFGIVHVSNGYILLGVAISLIVCWLLVRRSLARFFFVCAASVGCSALIIPLLRMTWTPLAERYMYIPSAFFVIGCSLTLQGWPALQKYKKPAVMAATLLAFVALYATSSRNLLWQDNIALFQDTIRKSPDFMPARNQLANELYAHGRGREANVIYKSFVDEGDLVNPQYGLVNKAFAYSQEGNFPEARKILDKALANPGKLEIMVLKQILQLNKMEVLQKKASTADVYSDNVRLLSRLSELTKDPFYQYRLGIVEMQDGSREMALRAFQAAAMRAPATAYYRNPALALCSKLSSVRRGVGGIIEK